MNAKCPKFKCKNPNIIKNGTFYRKSDSRVIKRFKCKSCGSSFSTATNDPCYYQKKRRINPIVERSLCSSSSQRRLALNLRVNRKTIARKLIFLAGQAYLKNKKNLENLKGVTNFQFDDLETTEHTKYKPVSVTLAVEPHSRKILGIEVSRMPAKGHLAKKSREKYGYRKDERPKAIEKLFEKISPIINENVTISSDQHPYYIQPVKKYFPQGKHIRIKGGRGRSNGQGELKKLVYDPIFILNHTFAMLRDNIKRLARETWCTTKKIERLRDHLEIYVKFHNEVLV